MDVLKESCLIGDKKTVEHLIRHRKCKNGLYWACRGGHMNIVELFILKGIKNIQSIQVKNGLCGACRGGHLQIAKLMISFYSRHVDDFNVRLNDFNFGLYEACQGGHSELVKFMIERGANDFNKGLEKACEGGHINVAMIMIEYGATHWNWNYGLYDACKGGYIDVAILAIEKGATDYNRGLCEACENDNLELVKLMIEKGATHWDRGLRKACVGYERDIQEELDLYDENQEKLGLYDENQGSWIEIMKLMIEKGATSSPFEKHINSLLNYGINVDLLKNMHQCRQSIKDRLQKQSHLNHLLKYCLYGDLICFILKPMMCYDYSVFN